MVGWYYVQGTERVGPVGEETLKDLFLREEINLESYVWRKGFENWERVKDVSDLDFKPYNKAESRVEKTSVEKIEEITPENILNFDWKSIGEEEELFFIKVGPDRKTKLETELFGPYSLIELRDAHAEKRINNRTLIFAAGMPGWVTVGDTPLHPKNFSLNISNLSNEIPLLIIGENVTTPLTGLVQIAGTEKCILLGSGAFRPGKVIMASLYFGNSLKAQHLKLNIEEYRPREQKVFCTIVELNESAKKVMQNYA
jgi:hypothetical protein